MKKTALLVLAFGTFMQPAWAAEDLMTSQLVDQARFWQQKNRDDIAAEIFRSLLRADPEHGEALIKLGLIEVRANNRRAALILLEHANHVKPRPPGLATLATALAVDTTGRGNESLPSVGHVPPKIEKRSKTNKPKNDRSKESDRSTSQDVLLLKP